ncbi:MAG: YvcK family protein, partial [Propionibacteriaceae bacterium]|nr:YvcK family protein [Propionibacteriaceae bacterium]
MSPFHRPPAVVAFGGGHGLAASLTALRQLTHRLTAVVTVADDGGSSGRLREEFPILPPGDLRMALAALCGDDEVGRAWAEVLQSRFPGDGPLGGHAIGNLLIAGLWQQMADPVAGLDMVAAMLHVEGRVLPMAAVPLLIEADATGADPARPDEVVGVVGQEAVALAT